MRERLSRGRVVHLLPSPSSGPPLLSASLSFPNGGGGGFVGGAGAAVGGGGGGCVGGGGGVMVLGGGGVMVLGGGGGGVMVLGGGGVMVLGGGAVRDDVGCRAALPTLVDAGDVVTTTTTAMIASAAVDRIVNRRRVRLIVVPFGEFPRLRARAQRRRTASAPPRISKTAPADSMTSAGVAHGASSLSMKPKKPRVALSANAAMLASR